MAKAGRGQTRRDSKRRVLRPGESVRADRKYQYKYHIDGKPHFVYSQGLNLGTLAINGTAFNDYFYYGNVARDSRVPFRDAKTYADYLAKTYLNAGGEQAGLNAVKNV